MAIAPNYRDRIYKFYVQARQTALAPETVAGFAPRLPYFDRMIRKHFPQDRNATVFEVGCGHGTLIYCAQTRHGYKNVSGVDGSPAQVEAARRLGVHGVEQADIFESLRARSPESIDVIVAFDVIEHFAKDELFSFADEVHRVLRPGGRWIIHAPNGESPFGSRMRYWDLTHEQAFTSESISQLLYVCGFSTVNYFEDDPVVHGITSAGRFLAWKMARGLLRLYLAAETGDTGRTAILSQNLLAVAIK